MSALVILGIAIVAEVIGTLAISLSKGFAVRPGLGLGVMIPSYSLSFVCLTLLMRRELMSMSVVYAIWVCLGVALTTVLMWMLGHQPLSPLQITLIVIIVAAAAGLCYLEQ